MRVRAADRAIRNLDLHFLRPDRLYRKVDNADLAPLRLVRILHITEKRFDEIVEELTRRRMAAKQAED